ncbi:hypothetical protein COCHEDRAFT_1034040 [Bipolaris maydis C5]|uniref:Hydrophobin n=1 Tax=Cochliobolus heterostrophus (strain C5 / ATCC 48332 / race O) TaxID=701091 RepID=M2UI82_COCH5|nr:hypothetical protein COCHEDRAFT_1034040 [Bipolaris maydis C5]KAH7555016.1 hypothetical protein BM1_07677 [Bipolaris maydis]
MRFAFFTVLLATAFVNANPVPENLEDIATSAEDALAKAAARTPELVSRKDWFSDSFATPCFRAVAPEIPPTLITADLTRALDGMDAFPTPPQPARCTHGARECCQSHLLPVRAVAIMDIRFGSFF